MKMALCTWISVGVLAFGICGSRAEAADSPCAGVYRQIHEHLVSRMDHLEDLDDNLTFGELAGLLATGACSVISRGAWVLCTGLVGVPSVGAAAGLDHQVRVEMRALWDAERIYQIYDAAQTHEYNNDELFRVAMDLNWTERQVGDKLNQLKHIVDSGEACTVDHLPRPYAQVIQLLGTTTAAQN